MNTPTACFQDRHHYSIDINSISYHKTMNLCLAKRVGRKWKEQADGTYKGGKGVKRKKK
jgi:hypothetical protein